jgi:adenosylcobinamide-GDP ribazoletransferase
MSSKGKAVAMVQTFKGNRRDEESCGFWTTHGAHVNACQDQTNTMSDLPPPVATPNADRFRPIAEVVHALRFLTRLPIPFSRTLDPPPLAQTMRMFSIAGAVIGVMVAAVLLLGQTLQLPSHLAAILAVAAGLLVTGGLHEDGLADTADGLGGGKTRERRLEIMRDSRIGSYGALALIVAVAARTAAYAALLYLQPLAIVAVIMACQSFSRALLVDLMWATPPARADGLSAYVGQPTRMTAIFAIVLGLVLTLAAGYFTSFENSVLALALGLAATAFVRALAVRLVGGQTGDICGAAQVSCEVMMLTAFLATLG